MRPSVARTLPLQERPNAAQLIGRLRVSAAIEHPNEPRQGGRKDRYKARNQDDGHGVKSRSIPWNIITCKLRRGRSEPSTETRGKRFLSGWAPRHRPPLETDFWLEQGPEGLEMLRSLPIFSIGLTGPKRSQARSAGSSAPVTAGPPGLRAAGFALRLENSFAFLACSRRYRTR